MGNITSSKTVTRRNLKILLWGAPGTRKTESVLRYFPQVLLIDTEGNSDQCVDMPAIPEFLQLKTKDPEEVRATIRDVAAGRIKFSDGRPVATVCVDSASVLWYVRQEAGANMAEKRAAKYGGADEASLTQRDWTLAKRPLVELNTELGNLPIPYIALIAREADKMMKKPGSTREDDLIKVGVKADLVKGTEYEFNLSLHMCHDMDATGKRGKWYCEVDKVQGKLGESMPVGKRFETFPWDLISANATTLKPAPGTDKSEVTTGSESAEKEGKKKITAEQPPENWGEVKSKLQGKPEWRMQLGKVDALKAAGKTPAEAFAELTK